MTTEQLSNFIEAAQCLSFTDVARRNFLTQPAITNDFKSITAASAGKFRRTKKVPQQGISA